MLWGVAGGLTAVGLEVLYRKGFGWGSWQEALLIFPFALFVSFCVYRVMNASDSFFFALIWFSLMTTIARVGIGFLYLREPATWTNLIAVAALAIASGARLWVR